MRFPRSCNLWLRAALLVTALLFVATGPALSYTWEVDTPQDWTVSSLRCTDIYLPVGTVKIEWDYAAHGPGVVPVYEVRRRFGATTTNLGTTTNKYWVDTFTWNWNSNYQYDVRVTYDVTGPSMMLPAPPPGADPAEIYYRSHASGNVWKTIIVTPRYTVCSANQAVDSRLDLRYATNVYKDFQFGSRIYRGGLFAGFANDPSRVGRSLVGFNLTAPATGTCYWTGSLHLYHTRNAATGTATIGAHEVSDAWTESGTVWSNAPTLTPGSPLVSQSIAWDSASPVSSWKHFTMEEPIGLSLLGDGLVSFALAATNEATNAWAYFAKSQWDSNYSPRIVYATGAPTAPLEIAATPNPVTGGSNSTGTVYLNGLQAANATVYLTSSNPSVASVPYSVSVTAGQISQTFTITTYTVATPTTVTLTASRNSYSETVTLTVNP